MFSLHSIVKDPTELLSQSGATVVRVRNLGTFTAYLGGAEGQHFPLGAKETVELTVDGALYAHADGVTQIVVLGAGDVS